MAHQGTGVSSRVAKRAHVSGGYSRTGVTYAAPGPPVAGYLAWWDATAITGQADNTALSTWTDGSAHHNDLTQASAGLKPTYYSTTSAKLINGKPTVWFNGGQVMAVSLARAQPFTVVYVGQATTIAAFPIVYTSNTHTVWLGINSNGTQ